MQDSTREGVFHIVNDYKLLKVPKTETDFEKSNTRMLVAEV